MKVRNYLRLIPVVLLLVFCSKNNNSQSNNKSADSSVGNDNIHEIVVKDMNGTDVHLGDYKGKVLLIVNVASECGYTPQYDGLESLYEKFREKGFEILAFPCNDFGAQEPGTNEEIKEFCTSKFGVTFKLFDKIKVLGEEKSTLYDRLTDNSVTGTEDIHWNFEKFLISKDGKILKRYLSKVKPLSEEIVGSIEAELNRS